MSETELEALVQMRIRNAQAAAWDAGFQSGAIYGQQSVQFNPQWDREDDAPTVPANPYRY